MRPLCTKQGLATFACHCLEEGLASRKSVGTALVFRGRTCTKVWNTPTKRATECKYISSTLRMLSSGLAQRLHTLSMNACIGPWARKVSKAQKAKPAQFTQRLAPNIGCEPSMPVSTNVSNAHHCNSSLTGNGDLLQRIAGARKRRRVDSARVHSV